MDAHENQHCYAFSGPAIGVPASGAITLPAVAMTADVWYDSALRDTTFSDQTHKENHPPFNMYCAYLTQLLQAVRKTPGRRGLGLPVNVLIAGTRG